MPNYYSPKIPTKYGGEAGHLIFFIEEVDKTSQFTKESCTLDTFRTMFGNKPVITVSDPVDHKELQISLEPWRNSDPNTRVVWGWKFEFNTPLPKDHPLYVKEQP